MTVLGTSEYGYVTGQVSGTPGAYGANITYQLDADNYVGVFIYLDDVKGYFAEIVSVLNGIPVFTWDMGSELVGEIPTNLGQAWFKCEVRETGNTKSFLVSIGASLDTLVKGMGVALYGLAGDNSWINEDDSALTPVLTEVAAAADVSPNPPEAGWYAYQNETVLDGAYARVSLLDVAGMATTIYSNAVDGDESLLSLNLQEYFDPTTTVAQVNSGSFSIYTPYDKSTPQSEIAAFLANFPKNGLLKVERGWVSTTSMGYEAYDTVVMGYFFITEAKLDRNTWVLTVEFHDTFGLLSETNLPVSHLWDASQISFALAAILNTADANIPLTTPDEFIDVDSAVDDHLIWAPSPVNVSSNILANRLANACGGRWYRDNTGRISLVCTPNIAKLNYKINDLHMYGIPSYEKWEQPPTPHTAAMHLFSTSAELSDIAIVPKFSGWDTIGTVTDITVEHGLCGARELYERTFPGGVETDTLIPDTFVWDDRHWYSSVLDSDIWIKTASPLELYNMLVIKGYAVTDTASNTGASVAGASLDNPYITYQYEANGVLSWSFPDYDERAYVFSMRDDPSLRCGNIVQLAVDNEYLDVLLVEAKRSFNGAGRVEFKAVYVADTGLVPFPVTVENATATWLDETSETSGVLITWDAITGYDDWPNPDFAYRVYRTSDTPDTLLADVGQSTLLYTTATATAEGDTFGVAVTAGGYEWPVTECTLVPFDNTQGDMRASGETLFYAGQDRLVYGSDTIS